MIGDRFLQDSMTAYRNCRPNLFLHENFETVIIASNYNTSNHMNVIARIKSSFINTMNARMTIPKWVVIIVEDDIIKAIPYKKIRCVRNIR